MKNGPFKMKGSPMKRNFGIGTSPAKQEKKPVGPVEPKKDEDGNVIKRSNADPTLVQFAINDKGFATSTKKKKNGLTGVVAGKKVTFTDEQLKNIGVE